MDDAPGSAVPAPTGRPPPPARSGSTPRPATARRQRQPLLFLVDHARRHATPCFRSPRCAPPGEPGPSLPVSVVDGAPAACTIDLSVRGTISPCTFAYATPSRLTVTGLYVELVGDCGHRSVGCWTGRGVMPLHHACGTIRPGLCGSRSQKRRLSEP